MPRQPCGCRRRHDRRGGDELSYPSGETWGICADNYTDKKKKVESVAVCVDPNLRLEFDSSSEPSARISRAGDSPHAASGEVGISGGHSNSGGFSTIGVRSLNPAPGGFGYAIDNYSDQTISITTHTVCFDPSV